MQASLAQERQQHAAAVTSLRIDLQSSSNAEGQLRSQLGETAERVAALAAAQASNELLTTAGSCTLIYSPEQHFCVSTPRAGLAGGCCHRGTAGSTARDGTGCPPDCRAGRVPGAAASCGGGRAAARPGQARLLDGLGNALSTSKRQRHFSAAPLPNPTHLNTHTHRLSASWHRSWRSWPAT